ncbi:MAG: hypothetical protein IEMM0006_0564 [bacterium]|nr:MAG: hypothetical protein IEMM0006_0564 [bacterium]
MCAKKRKLKTQRPKGSLFSILLVFVIISILAAAVAYFFFDIGGKKDETPAKPSVSITKTSSEDQQVRTKNPLDGTWVSKSDGRMLEIHGISFSMELPSVSSHQIIKGEIHITGNTVTFVYSGSKDKCGENPGTYSFVINNGNLHFSVEHDKCPNREQIFSATWEKF